MSENVIHVRITKGFEETHGKFLEICKKNGSNPAEILRKLEEAFVNRNYGKKLDFDFSLGSLEMPVMT